MKSTETTTSPRCESSSRLFVTMVSTLFSIFVNSTLGDFDTEEIKLSEIEANILVLAIDFWSRGPRAMLTKPKETTNKNIYKEEVSDWEYSFMEGIGFEQAQELLIAASYLDSPILIDAWSAFIAHKLKQISIERFENTYNIDMNISSDKEIELMEKYKILIVDDPDSYFNAIK